jgi:TatD DNase family protein
VVDTHCHLDSSKASDGELVARAREVGVTRIATVGMNPESIERAVAAANAYEEVYAIVGRHPNEATGCDPARDMEPIERATADPRVRAIGETGLDYFRDYAPRDDQRRAVEAQIDLAARLGLPLVIHTRAAEEDTFAMLRERAGDVTVVLHCFSAADRLDECVERGYICSFAGNVTYPKATDLQQAARDVPDELIMVETDSPYLSPQPVRGKPNEPANVIETARYVAEIRGASYTEFEETVERNAARVFGW